MQENCGGSQTVMAEHQEVYAEMSNLQRSWLAHLNSTGLSMRCGISSQRNCSWISGSSQGWWAFQALSSLHSSPLVMVPVFRLVSEGKGTLASPFKIIYPPPPAPFLRQAHHGMVEDFWS